MLANNAAALRLAVLVFASRIQLACPQGQLVKNSYALISYVEVAEINPDGQAQMEVNVKGMYHCSIRILVAFSSAKARFVAESQLILGP